MLLGQSEQTAIGTTANDEIVDRLQPGSIALWHGVCDIGERDPLRRADHTRPGVSSFVSLGHDPVNQEDVCTARHHFRGGALAP